MTEFNRPLTVEDVVKIVAESFDLTPKKNKGPEPEKVWNLEVGKKYKVEILEGFSTVEKGFYEVMAGKSIHDGMVTIRPNACSCFYFHKTTGFSEFGGARVIEEIIPKEIKWTDYSNNTGNRYLFNFLDNIGKMDYDIAFNVKDADKPFRVFAKAHYLAAKEYGRFATIKEAKECVEKLVNG